MEMERKRWYLSSSLALTDKGRWQEVICRQLRTGLRRPYTGDLKSFGNGSLG